MRITEIQRFCMHDGPGLRTTVFLKGCPLRCAWCHNPETQEPFQQLLFYRDKCIGCGACAAVCPTGARRRLTENGFLYDRSRCRGCLACADACPTAALEPSLREMSAEEVFREIERDRAFYGRDGGVTLSGGEPLLQGEEVLALFAKCRAEGIGTAVETCGYFDGALLPALVPLTGLFLWDFKDGDDERHKKNTGVSNARIRENLLFADSLGAETVLRCILVRGVNTEDRHYRAVAALFHELRHCLYAELIPYHAYGGAKMLPLGLPDNGNPAWIPAEEDMENARTRLTGLGVRLRDQG